MQCCTSTASLRGFRLMDVGGLSYRKSPRTQQRAGHCWYWFPCCSLTCPACFALPLPWHGQVHPWIHGNDSEPGEVNRASPADPSEPWKLLTSPGSVLNPGSQLISGINLFPWSHDQFNPQPRWCIIEQFLFTAPRARKWVLKLQPC